MSLRPFLAAFVAPSLAGMMLGCGATGNNWVHEPMTVDRATSEARVLSEDDYRSATMPQRQVIRLGELETTDAPRNATAAPAGASPGAPVTVTQTTNVYVVQPAYYAGYGSMGYPYNNYGSSYGGRSAGSIPTTSLNETSKTNTTRAPTAIRPGGNFPPIADYGPPMLTTTGPQPTPYFR